MSDKNSLSRSHGSSRRGFLRTAGAVAATAAGLGFANSTAAAEYRTVEVSAGDQESVTVPDEGTLENVLYDVTADGASVSFNANGSDWTMRNVGVKGAVDADTTLLHASVPDADGTGVVENVYFGDGTADRGSAGVWVDATGDDAHRGTLTFDRVHVANCADNGIYGSGPGARLGPGDGGEVHIRNSFAHNNNVSQFRLGTNGSTITNSLALVDGDVPAGPGGSEVARGLWLREGARNVAIEDSTTAIRHADGTRAIVAGNLDQGSVGNSTVEGGIRGNGNLEFRNLKREVPGEIVPPSDVPMTAAGAARR